MNAQNYDHISTAGRLQQDRRVRVGNVEDDAAALRAALAQLPASPDSAFLGHQCKAKSLQQHCKSVCTTTINPRQIHDTLHRNEPSSKLQSNLVTYICDSSIFFFRRLHIGPSGGMPSALHNGMGGVAVSIFIFLVGWRLLRVWIG